jgi:uncharacterized membrane protein
MKKKQNSIVKKIQGQNDRQAKNLRHIAVLSVLGIIDFIPITLYQLGVIKHLPEPPGKIFNSDKVNASKEAEIAGLPDGGVSMLMYAANVVLTGAALTRTRNQKIFNYGLAGIALGQAGGGLYYLYNMAKVQKKICIYCVAGALINLAALLPVRKVFLNGK